MLMDRKSLHMPSPLPPKNLAVTKPTLFSSAHSSQCTAPTMQLACPHTLHCKICTPCSLLNLFGLGWPERPSCLLSPQLHRAHTFSNKQVHWLEDFLNWDHSSKEESQQFLPINPPHQGSFPPQVRQVVPITPPRAQVLLLPHSSQPPPNSCWIWPLSWDGSQEKGTETLQLACSESIPPSLCKPQKDLLPAQHISQLWTTTLNAFYLALLFLSLQISSPNWRMILCILLK